MLFGCHNNAAKCATLTPWLWHYYQKMWHYLQVSCMQFGHPPLLRITNLSLVNWLKPQKTSRYVLWGPQLCGDVTPIPVKLSREIETESLPLPRRSTTSWVIILRGNCAYMGSLVKYDYDGDVICVQLRPWLLMRSDWRSSLRRQSDCDSSWFTFVL